MASSTAPDKDKQQFVLHSTLSTSGDPFLPLIMPRPELGTFNQLQFQLANIQPCANASTAELAASAPRYRRKSSTFIDGIHDHDGNEESMAPAQLYSTMSGRLFHSGRIAIIMVGLPARGKTHISVSLTRYLQWLGVKTRIFHLGDYRRATVEKGIVPEDYFLPTATPSSVVLRQKIMKKCREDVYGWLDHDNGQVAIYDAVNPQADGRRALAKEFSKHDVHTIFIESFVDDERILQQNARNVKISSPDFKDMEPDAAAQLYLKRMKSKIPCFETMNQLKNEGDLNFIRMINAGQSFFYNNMAVNYISNRIVFFLTNLHIKNRSTFFARAGHGADSDSSYRADEPLNDKGRDYARKMADALQAHREAAHRAENGGRYDPDEQGNSIAATIPPGHPDHVPMRALNVWTSPRRNTIETADALVEKGFPVRLRSQMSQMNPGVCEKLSPRSIRAMYPGETEKHQKDPYHHRYPRAESYHDLAVRLEPIILELEREENDLLIIAHESVLRVLYAYLMHCSTMEIPSLVFHRNEIIEIRPAAYQNEARRIPIPGVDDDDVDEEDDDDEDDDKSEEVVNDNTTTTTEDVPDEMATTTGEIAAPSCTSPDPSISPRTMSPIPGAPRPAMAHRASMSTPAEMVADKIDDED